MAARHGGIRAAFIPNLIGSSIRDRPARRPPSGIINLMQTIVRLSGALLGIILGFGLGLLILDRTGDLIDPANRPAFLVAVVVAALLFGYLAIPYATLYPTRWAVTRLSEAGAADFVLGVVGLLVGLLMGALIGIPLAALGSGLGTWLPVFVSLTLAAIMAGAFMYKRDAILKAFGGRWVWRAARRPEQGGGGHERGHRRPDRGHRQDRIHPRLAGRAPLRPRRAAAHRRLARRPPPQPGAPRARDAVRAPEGLGDPGRDQRGQPTPSSTRWTPSWWRWRATRAPRSSPTTTTSTGWRSCRASGS